MPKTFLDDFFPDGNIPEDFVEKIFPQVAAAKAAPNTEEFSYSTVRPSEVVKTFLVNPPKPVPYSLDPSPAEEDPNAEPPAFTPETLKAFLTGADGAIPPLRLSQEAAISLAKPLLQKAFDAAAYAYVPYSHFRVGAALLALDGTVFTGCNVENRSFGLTICAERNALAAAIAQGAREFLAIAIAAPDSAEPIPPCGACRQVLSEFLGPDAAVIFKGSGQEHLTLTLGDLFPMDALQSLKDTLPPPKAP